jgi:hypothetical protein
VLRALVAGQVAITVVLLVGAGLFVKSFARLITVEDGLDTSGVVTLRVALTAEYDDPRRVDLFFEELVSRSAALPGVPRGACHVGTAVHTGLGIGSGSRWKVIPGRMARNCCSG